MSSSRLAAPPRRLVVAGFCLGLGLGPLVLTVLTAPVEFLAGETVAALFWPAVQFLAVIFAVVVLSMAGRAASDEEAAESDDATTGRR